jgi:hypothetical protein
MKIKNFKDFSINEIFGFKKKAEPVKQSRVDACVLDILDFLKDNDITTWEQFTTTGKFNRWVIDNIIDSNCDNMQELKEVRYKIRLKLSDVNELQQMLNDYEEEEEYEICSEIQKEIEKKTTS